MINVFRETALFDNLIANQLCDELVSVVTPEDESLPLPNILLTGAAAYALQTEHTEPIENIIFRLANNEDYLKLLNYLDQISTRELIKYANRTYFKFPAGSIELCVMLMFDEDREISYADYNGIKIESLEHINPEIL